MNFPDDCAPCAPHAQLAAQLQRVAAGDERALRRLIGATHRHLYHVVLGVLRRNDWAEECLQDVYFAVWRSSARYTSGSASPMSWLIGIARHKAIDRLRHELAASQPVQPASPDMECEGPDDADPLLRDRVRIALASLAPHERQAVALAYLHDFSHGEVAQHLRVPLGTAKSWLRRGLARLRALNGLHTAK